MAYSVELVGSREGTEGPDPSRVLRYMILGTDDENLVYALTNAAAPAVYSLLFKHQVRIKQEGEEAWWGDVEYSQRKKGDPGQIEWSFEIGSGASVHIDTSLETIAKYPATAPDFKQALNVQQDGNGRRVDGLNIDLTTFSWSETHYLTYASITPAYIATLRSLRGRVNDAAWRVYAKGEVQLMCVTGSPKGEYTVPLTFSFEAIANRANFAIGAIENISKEGWQYLWTWSERKEDAVAKALVVQPKAAYVEKIHEYGDFTGLGLPDPWA